MGHSDFAYLPFGAGSRKCVGDQFACMEAVITLVMLIKRFDIELAMRPEDVGIYTGATIHTRNGLHMRIKNRVSSSNNNDNNSNNDNDQASHSPSNSLSPSDTDAADSERDRELADITL